MSTITRHDLYDMIWSLTKSKTAQKLNVPLQYLTNVCKENNIPTPSTGYWQQLSWGRIVEKELLPHPEINNMIQLNPEDKKCKIHNNEFKASYSRILDKALAANQEEMERKEFLIKAKSGQFRLDFNQTREKWMDNIGNVVKAYQVPDILKSKRDIVFQSKGYLRLKRLSGCERIVHPDYHKFDTHLNIQAESEQCDRALRIFDTVISIMEALGGNMEYEGQSTCVVFMNDIKISMSIVERSKRIDAPKDKSSYNKYIFVPSGLLRLNLCTRYRDDKIEDTSLLRLEDKLDVIVKKSIQLIGYELDRRELERLREIERKRMEEERRLEEERRRKLEMIRAEERQKVRGMFRKLRRYMFIEFLNKVLGNWDSVRQMESISELDINSEERKQLLTYDELKSLRQMIECKDIDGYMGHLSEDDIDVLIEEFYKMK